MACFTFRLKKFFMFELPRSEILRKQEFQKVYSHGKSFACRDMIVYVWHDSEYNGKVGFAAGKKLGCAVVRNKVKRIMREAYRLNKNKISRDCAIILIGRKNLVDAKLDAVEKSFLEVCKRAKILSE